MKWLLIILVFYVLPLIILFKNQNFIRANIYGAMYIVVATVIVICNIYISTINKIERNLECRKNYINTQYKEIKNNNKVDKKRTTKKFDKENIKEQNFKLNEVKEIESLNLNKEKEYIKDFKNNIYKIERKALIPMRNCLPDNKDLKINSKTIKKAEKDVTYAKKMCDEVVNDYEKLEISKLLSEDKVNQLQYSKICMQKAYILRGKAMECAQSLLKTKNLKYINQIKAYLSLSDKEVRKFVDTMKGL